MFIGVLFALFVLGGFAMLAASLILGDITYEVTGELRGDRYPLFGGPYRDWRLIRKNLRKHRELYPQSHRVRNYKITVALALFLWVTGFAIFLGH